MVLFQQEHSLLIIVHSFARSVNSITIPIENYDPNQVEWQFSESSIEIKLFESGVVQILNFPAFSGLVVKII